MPTYSDNVRYRKQVDSHTRDKDGKYCTYCIEKTEEKGEGTTAFDIRRLSYNLAYVDNLLIVGYTLQRLVEGAHNDEIRKLTTELMAKYEELVGTVTGETNIIAFTPTRSE